MEKLQTLKSGQRVAVDGVLTVLLGALALAGSAAARADVIFDFDDVAVGTITEFSDTQSGITATFSSPNDPGGFDVQESFFAPPFAGNALLSPGGDEEEEEGGSGGFTLRAFSGGINGTPIGVAQAFGAFPENEEANLAGLHKASSVSPARWPLTRFNSTPTPRQTLPSTTSM